MRLPAFSFSNPRRASSDRDSGSAWYEVLPLGEVRDTVVDWELLAARHADHRARRPPERAAACRAHQAGNALAGPLFHSQKSLPGACPGRVALSSDLPAPLLQSPRGERGSADRKSVV